MPNRLPTMCFGLFLGIALQIGSGTVCSDFSDTQSYQLDIASLLVKRCLACHNAKKLEGNYSIASFRDLLRAGDSARPPIVPGKPIESELYRRLIDSDPEVRMPAEAEPLTPRQIELIAKWITSLKSDSLLSSRPIEELVAYGPTHVASPRNYTKRLPITALAATANGNRVFANGYGEVTIWDTANGQLAGRVPVGWSHIADIEVTRTGDVLAVSAGIPGQLGVVQLIRVHDQSPPMTLATGSDLFPDIAFSPDESRISVGGSDGSLRVFECTSGKSLHRSTPHADCLNAVTWAGGGEYILTASRDRTAKLFRAHSFELIASFDRHERTVGGVAGLGSLFASVDETGKLRIWPDDGTDRELAEWTGLARSAQRITANPTHLLIADRHLVRRFYVTVREEDAGKDEQGKLKKKNKTTILASPSLTLPAGTRIMSLCVVAAEKILAGTDNGEIHVWSLDNERHIRSFKANP